VTVCSVAGGLPLGDSGIITCECPANTLAVSGGWSLPATAQDVFVNANTVTPIPGPPTGYSVRFLNNSGALIIPVQIDVLCTP
jgi:hypothetical protein